jgi:hypothetical protein
VWLGAKSLGREGMRMNWGQYEYRLSLPKIGKKKGLEIDLISALHGCSSRVVSS